MEGCGRNLMECRTGGRQQHTVSIQWLATMSRDMSGQWQVVPIEIRADINVAGGYWAQRQIAFYSVDLWRANANPRWFWTPPHRGTRLYNKKNEDQQCWRSGRWQHCDWNWCHAQQNKFCTQSLERDIGQHLQHSPLWALCTWLEIWREYQTPFVELCRLIRTDKTVW